MADSQERAPFQPPAASNAALAEYPWAVLPTDLRRTLEPAIPHLAEVLVREISTQVPEYSGRRSDRFWAGIRLGVEQSLREFTQLLGERRGPDGRSRAVARGLGRNEHGAGRTLDALQAAYRIGARHSWRALAQTVADSVTTEQLTALAESIFAFVDELAAESVAGYAESQAAAASEQERVRGLLLSALTGPAQDGAEIRRLATAAGWRLPERIAAVCLVGGGLRRIANALGPDVLVAPGEGDDVTVVLWPDPLGPGRGSLLDAALARLDVSASVGPPVPLALAARSLRGARSTLELGLRGALGPAPWAWQEHLLAIGLAQGEEPLLELADRLLAPLRNESEGSRMRLLATLEAVFDAGGNHGAAAHALGVHVQTVRYRLGRLRELLGPRLDDPSQRFELQVAVRARKLSVDKRDASLPDRRR